MLCVHVSICTHVKNVMDSGNLVCCLAFTLQKAIVSGFLLYTVFLCFSGEESSVVSLHLFCSMVRDTWSGALEAAGAGRGQLEGGSCLWQNCPWGLTQPN